MRHAASRSRARSPAGWVILGRVSIAVTERVTGIEPAFSAWEADVLPLNYTRRTDEIVPTRPTVRLWSRGSAGRETH